MGFQMQELKVATWNVQGISLRGVWKREAKSVAKFAEEKGWDAVLLSEADGVGVVWMGQDAELTAIVHSEKAAVLLRGELLKRWCSDGQKNKLFRRLAAVKVDGVALVLFYMPVSSSEVAAVEEAREEVMAALDWMGSDSGNNR